VQPVSLKAPDIYDLIVVGAGHAGCEAALAAARMGAEVCLITFNLDNVAALSCNPAVGGLAKGHLVREIDALGGEMAKNTDDTGIQFRLLNRGKGPAVWSSRAQVDIDLYPRRMRGVCQAEDRLWLLEAEVRSLMVKQGRVQGVITQRGQEIAARSVLLTTGTFLRGVIHIGLTNYQAGRMGDPPSNALSDQLRELGFNLRRLKTGTTPRLDSRSLDLKGLPEQWGDANPRAFSFLSDGPPPLKQLCCWITHTNEATHEVIRANLEQAPMYAGRISGTGARYCPSIEDKVVRFADKESHQVFLEPQGLENGLIYPNGIPTSLPLSVQEQMVKSLPGCENGFIARPGYAIEYDMSDPQDLGPDLMSRKLMGLFMAGQINGTSGYEEAACQGFMAAIGAVRWVRGEEPFILDRSQAYIGVLIDDLVTKGTAEPYRMFTSRAEYRLSLREDNADLRLTALGRDIGLVDGVRWEAFSKKREAIEEAWSLLNKTGLNPTASMNDRLVALGSAPLKRPLTAAQVLRRPELDLHQVAGLHENLARLRELSSQAAEQIEIRAHYAGYEEREREQVARFRQREQVRIPEDMDYESMAGLSREVKEKLTRMKPANLGQAGRISGVTPAALAVLSLHLHHMAKVGEAARTDSI
jgi:tRNA uridine 5-carboxymethylaminomethyl modification enzyme